MKEGFTMKGFQRTISFCLAMCLLLSALPLQGFAEEVEEIIQTEEVVEEELPEETAAPTEETAPPATETETEPVETTLAEDILFPTEKTMAPMKEATVPTEETTPAAVEVAEFAATEELKCDVAMNAVDTVASGTCGDNLTWVLDSEGTLTISGTGDMDDGLTYEYGFDYDLNGLMIDNRNRVKTVVIEEGVTSIGRQAFHYCPNLKSVTIPSSVTKIGSFAFGNCTSLTSIRIPSSVTSIYPSVFAECTSLESILVDENNSMYSSQNGVLLSKDGTILLSYPVGKEDQEYLIPSGVTDIMAHAFIGSSNLRSISIPSSVTVINSYAFTDCTNLTSITIPSKVTEIGYSAFQSCSSLTNIIFQGDAPEIMYTAFVGVTATAYYPENNPTWTDAVMQDYNGTYSGSITWVEGLPPEGDSCGDRLVWNFDDTTGILTISGRGNMNDYTSTENVPWADIYDSIRHIVIGIGAEHIGEYAFANCGALTSVTMPESMDSVGKNAFQNCINLKQVLYQGNAEKLEKLTIDSGNEPLEQAAFIFVTISDYLDNNAIEINGSGSAYAYYVGEPNTQYAYVIDEDTEGTAWSNENGVFQVALGSFDTPGTYSITVQITKIGGETLDTPLELLAKVTVTPLSFTQEWEISFDASVAAELTKGIEGKLGPAQLDATLAAIEGEVGGGAAMTVSRELSGDKETLELTSDVKFEGGAKLKSGITAKTLTSKFSPVSASAGMKSSITGTYGIKFEDYSAGNNAQQQAIATYLLGEALRVSPASLMLQPFYSYLKDFVYTYSGATVIEGSAIGLSGSLQGDVGAYKVNDEKLFTAVGAGGSVSVSMSEKSDTAGEKEKSASYKTEYDLSLLSGEIGGALGADVLGKDMKITAKQNAEGKSLIVSSLSASAIAPSFEIMGKNYTSDYHKYTFTDDALNGLLSSSTYFDSFLNGSRMLLSVPDLGYLANIISESNVPIQYNSQTKDQVLYSIPFEIGGAIGVGLDLGIDLSYLEKTSYTNAMGYGVDDTLMLTSKSNNVGSLVAAKKHNLPEFFTGVLKSLANDAKNFFNTVVGTVKDGVEAAWGWITEKAESTVDWVVSIITPDGTGGRSAWSTSYSVRTLGRASEAVAAKGFSGVGNYAESKAATIGRPFVISVTDNATGEAITDLSAEPLEFTIRYAEEDLTAAGLSKYNSIVQNGGIAMYRYSDNGDYFEYVGGVNDLDAMTVTATITKTGQYVLAADSCAPALSGLDISDFHETPTITAYIDDLTGLNADAFVFCLDGSVKVDSSNLTDHYITEAGLFTYTVPEDEALSEGQHTMSFTLADTTGNTETYDYSFNVDLTPPVVSEVTVTGSPNEGSAVEIRAKVSDPNLTAVYAVLSKRLADGTWSQEIATAMGDMGDGLWGLDYEGDGSSVKVYVKAVDIAENTAQSEFFEVKPYAETVALSQEYIVLWQNQTHQLQAEVTPAELTDSVTWNVEEGSDEIISVENGLVKGLNPGTGYVLAEVTDGETALTARCRVDVRESTQLDGVQLSTTKITSELYSTKYTTFDILLILPQNVPEEANFLTNSRSAIMASAELENTGVAMEKVSFTNPNIAKYFEIVVLDDRTVQVVPTQEAIDNAKSVESKYTDTLTVTVQGQDYITEKLTLTVTKSTPKLKVSVPTFNSFYNGQSKEVVVTGGTVTSIYENKAKNTSKSSAVPNWLLLEDGVLTLTEDAPLKNTSGKVYLRVETEEWRIPADLTLSVKNTFKRPSLKLSASTVTMTTNTENSDGIPLILKCSSKKETLSKWNIIGIEAPEGYYVTNFDPDTGAFRLHGEEDFQKGKITLRAVCGDTVNRIPLTLTVKTATVTLKLSKSSVTLNKGVNDSTAITVTATPKDYRITAPTIRLTDDSKQKNDKLNSGELDVRWDDGVIYVNTTETTPANTTYKLYISAGGSKEASATIQIVDKTPTVSFKAKGFLDLSFPENAVTVTPTFKNYIDGKIADFTYTITEMKGKKVVNPDVSEYFGLIQEGNTFCLTWKNAENISLSNTYVLKIAPKLPDGTEVKEAQISFTVKRSNIKLKLGASKVSLNQAVEDTTDVAVSCATKGYVFEAPILELRDSKGKIVLSAASDKIEHEKLKVTWTNKKLHIVLGENTLPGESFQVKVKANSYSSAYTLTVSIPQKSTITASLKVKSSIDVIRHGSTITVTPSYKNCMATTEREEALMVYTSKDKYKEPVDGLFDIQRDESGKFILTNKAVDPNLKYKVQLVTKFGDMEVKSAQTAITVKTGSAKLSLKTTKAIMFSKDKNSRATFRISTSDTSLNSIAQLKFKDSKQVNLFEILDYGNGNYALSFKGGVVDKSLSAKTKTLTIPIQVYLNGSNKANVTLNLKVTILK